MKIDFPSAHHIHQQRSLWQTAFGDTNAFLDSFFRTAYAPERCRCALEDNRILANLYWIDCCVSGQKLAYIYAVATHPDHRGKGLCRMLMENTHTLLRSQGYAGTVLVPQKESLRKMYAGMGYTNIGGLSEFSCTSAESPVALHTIGPEEFARLRRNLLPETAVIQEGAGLAFLAEQMQFYAGNDFLMAAYWENGKLHAPEFLGRADAAPGVLATLGISNGTFRMPGTEKPFAMYCPLTENTVCPDYFGFAFD